MNADPKFGTPELEPVEFDPEFQARIAATQKRRADDHQAGMDGVLADAVAAARRIAAKEGMSSDPSIYGEHCVNCEKRWCLPADKASCAHMAICESCYPNGCPDCEREVEEDLKRREAAAARILTAAFELRTGADDLSETDLGLLDWRARADILRHVELTSEALRRVRDVLRSGEKT